MNTKNTTTVHIDERRLTIDRIYNATPERLFEAWTNPALVSQWLAPGPMKCSLPVYDARRGGRFRIEMTGRGPDGVERTFVYEGTFDELIPGERVVMTWQSAAPAGASRESDPPSVVTATFTPVEGGTRMRLTQDVPNAEFAKGASAGWGYALDKLANVV